MRYIYTLSDPRDGKVVYVGCATNAQDRLALHLKSTNTTRVSIWVRDLVAETGTIPILSVIETCDGTGFQEEMKWIKHFRRLGIDLLNDRDLEKYHSEETKKKMSEEWNLHHKREHFLGISKSKEGRENIAWSARHRPKVSEETRKRMSESAKKAWTSRKENR